MNPFDLSTAETAVFIAGCTLIVTTVLSVITAYYAVQTKRLVDESRRATELTAGAVVLIGLEKRGQLLVATLKNYGQRSARDVTFAAAPPADDLAKQAFGWGRLCELFDSEIAWLPPGKTIYRDAGTEPGVAEWERANGGGRLTLGVQVSYHNGFRYVTEAQVLAPQDVIVSQVLAPGPNLEMDPETRLIRALERISEPNPHGASILSQLARIATALKAPPTQGL